MKIKNTLVFCILLLFLGCSKVDENNNSTEEQIEISLYSEKINLKNLEIANFTVENFELTKDTYYSKLGDTDVVLIKTNNTTLSFIIPDNVEFGKHILKPEFTDKTLEFNISKSELTTNPKDVLTSYFGNLETNFEQTIDLFSENDVPEEILFAQNRIMNAQIEFNKLSEADKLIAATFIQNNTEGFNELENELNEMLSSPPENKLYHNKKRVCNATCHIFNFVKILGAGAAAFAIGESCAVLGAVVGVVLAIEIGISVISGRNSILAHKIKLGCKKIAQIPYFVKEKLAEVTFNPVNQSIQNFKTSNKNKNVFENETQISFKIKPTFRTLNIEDKDSHDSAASTYIDAYLKFKPVWDKLFLSNQGSLPTFNNNTQQTYPEELSQFAIVITDNSKNVSVSAITGTVENFKATFSNSTETEQDFSFDIIFNDKGIIAKKTINATISAADPCIDNNAPIITNIRTGNCNPNRPRTSIVIIDFEADGIGFNPSGSYFGGNIDDYPVRLENTDGSFAYNGYSAKLISGDKYKGTIQINFSLSWSSYILCESSGNWNQQYVLDYKVALVDDCDQKSTYNNVQISYYGPE